MGGVDRGAAEHWNDSYRTRGADGVSWFQAEPTVSLELLDALAVPTGEPIVDVGGGASTLVDALLTRGYEHVRVVDLSDAALEEARQRVGPNHRAHWTIADVRDWRGSVTNGLWHDRAVFHFLVDAVDRHRYVDSLRANLHTGGAVILGTFAADGPTACSGLPVARYDADALVSALGAGFDVVATRREEHVTPSGATQPFTWIAARMTE